MTRLAPGRVAPFGHLGITACVPLPRASRSLPRPSSPPCAQASPTCLHSLDYIVVKQNTRITSQSTSLPRLARPSHGSRRTMHDRASIKIPFPTNRSSTKKTNVDDPSSVLHLSNSGRDSSYTLAVSLAIYSNTKRPASRTPRRSPARARIGVSSEGSEA
jgi:hypothetical protein